MELIFLGTGGGRYVTGEQKRKTAGIVIKSDETQIHVDPGPGALVYSHKELKDPLDTEAVIISHGHLDHSNDAEAIIEMIAESGGHAGGVFGSESVLEGYGDIEKRISNYHQKLMSRKVQIAENTVEEFKDVEIRSQKMFHSDPTTVGFTVENSEKKIGFWTDSEPSEELYSFYEGCDTLVVFCTRPRNARQSNHTSLSDVPDIVESTEVENVIITHFGYKFLESDLEEQKEWLKDEVDCKVIFAEDGMRYPGNRSLSSF